MASENIFEEISLKYKNQNWVELLPDLQGLTNRLQNIEYRSQYGSHVYKSAKEILPNLWMILQDSSQQTKPLNSQNIIYLKILTECYRTLRNASAGSLENQNLLPTHTEILKTSEHILDNFSSSCNDSEDVLITLRCAVQFLGNVCVGNATNQSIAWNLFLPVIGKCVSCTKDTTLTNYCCMFIHSCLVNKLDSEGIPDSPCLFEIVSTLLHKLVDEDLEWGLLVVEDVLLIPQFLSNLNVSSKERLFLVEVIIDVLKKTKQSSKRPIHISNLTYLSEIIDHHSHHILSVGLTVNIDEPMSWMLVKMIEALGLATSSLPHGYTELQADSSLLCASLNLLKGIDEIGRTGTNQFNSVDKMSELGSVDTDHPVFGLKRDLIRLIANLVNKHKENQDKMRDMDGIPLLLNQTTIDGKNPYITQWVVLAIHNLCEDNSENKAFISSLQLQGIANNHHILNELGIETQLEGDKVVVRNAENRVDPK